MDERLLAHIKSATDTDVVLAGYGVIFGGVDLAGETFAKDVNLNLAYVPVKDVFFEHNLDASLRGKIGKVVSEKIDDVGLWLEMQIERSNKYIEAVLELVKQGKLGISTGTIGHLADREGSVIKAWTVAEASVTPIPCEPRTLGVSRVKSETETPGQAAPDGAQTQTDPLPYVETTVSTTAAADTPQENNMDEKDIELKIADALKAHDAARQAEADRKADEEKRIEERAMEIVKARYGRKGGYLFHSVAERGDDNDGMKAWTHYVRTGQASQGMAPTDIDPGADGMKAAYAESSGAVGGYTVPTPVYNAVIEKRNELSIARRAGARVLQTSGNVVEVPIEGTSMNRFVIVGEGTAADEDEPTLGTAKITVYGFSRLVKASWEVLADNDSNLEQFIYSAAGRAIGLTENYYLISTGTGTSQPKAALIGGTLGTTAASATAITAAEVIAQFYQLSGAYRDGAVWVTTDTTEAYIRGLQVSNTLAFLESPQGKRGAGANMPMITGGFGELMGMPVMIDSTMPAQTASLKPLMCANFNFYVMAERPSIVAMRLNELYAASGQVGFVWYVRFGGNVGQAEAFQYLQMHS